MTAAMVRCVVLLPLIYLLAAPSVVPTTTPIHDGDGAPPSAPPLVALLHWPRSNGTLFGAAMAQAFNPSQVCHLAPLVQPTPWPLALARAESNAETEWAADLRAKLAPCVSRATPPSV